VAGVVAIATLVGTSAFAESRHRNTTNGDSARQSSHERSDRGGNRSSDRQSTRSNTNYDRQNQARVAPQVDRSGDRGRSQSDGSRNADRGRTQSDGYRNGNRSLTQADAYRSADRGRTQPDSFRNGDRGRFQSEGFRSGGNERSQSRGNYNSRSSYDSRGRQSMSIEGRVNRFTHERGGYRIWIDGGRYPVWIPEARISLFPHLRVGLSLRLGGYYDPLGYLEAYDYYDGAGTYGMGAYGAGTYGIGAYGAGAYSSGVLRGVVETIDYRRGTLVLRDDASGNFVTAVIRDRRMESLRPGDFAEISGDWTRAGVFEALSLEDVRGGRY
jgi:hypothetical protein